MGCKDHRGFPCVLGGEGRKEGTVETSKDQTEEAGASSSFRMPALLELQGAHTVRKGRGHLEDLRNICMDSLLHK